jgi:hypothetical protein
MGNVRSMVVSDALAASSGTVTLVGLVCTPREKSPFKDRPSVPKRTLKKTHNITKQYNTCAFLADLQLQIHLQILGSSSNTHMEFWICTRSREEDTKINSKILATLYHTLCLLLPRKADATH